VFRYRSRTTERAQRRGSSFDDPQHNQQYLSAEFFEVLNAVIIKARQLGLVLDIVAGTGWPYGGPTVTPEESARTIQRVRLEARPGAGINLPVMKPGEHVIAAFHVRPDGFHKIDATSPSIQLENLVPGSEIQFFYSTVTGQQVKRASAGAEGHVLDHYSGKAVRHYLDEVGAKLLSGTPAASFRSFFCDSLEVYRANRTSQLAEQFQQRRGYDLIDRLPVLFDPNHAESRDVRHDFWKMLDRSELPG
jgi:hypothetical protein